MSFSAKNGISGWIRLLANRHRGGIRIETPELEVRYTAPADSGFLRKYR